jgi:hypothetical protein
MLLARPTRFAVLVAASVALVCAGTAVSAEHAARPLPAVWVSARGTAAGENSAAAIGLTVNNSLLHNSTAEHGLIGLHTLRVANPAGHWRIYCPDCVGYNSCLGNRSTVSEQGAARGCLAATNAGPFGMWSNVCIGPVVSEGVIVHNRTSKRACVGMTPAVQNRSSLSSVSSSSAEWYFGSVASEADVGAVLPLMDNFVCGFDWLVHDGAAVGYAEGGEVAPRTLIGVQADGTLVEAVAEGSEWLKTGLTMREWANFAVTELKLRYAINVDGGGSSTLWWRDGGGVQGCPTGIDAPICLERPVNTITCIV